MGRKKYMIVTNTGLEVFESNSKLMCKAYIRQAVKKGSKPGFLSIAEDWPEETRCDTCAKAAECPAFHTGVIYPLEILGLRVLLERGDSPLEPPKLKMTRITRIERPQRATAIQN